ncbi:hypothetical protein [Enterobacter kobei]|uniref:hypothetical protein n=1 Tax=Enterobacter kobei TaxID=208224 RepID=UPI003CF1566F
MVNERINATTEMAIKIRDAVQELLAQEGKDSPVMEDEAMWLAMQMICGPHEAAMVVTRSQIRP